MTARISTTSTHVHPAHRQTLRQDQERHARWAQTFLNAARLKKSIVQDDKTPFSGHFSKK